eukprot:CAMPEP_0195297292 /NCGR_PEP_ID=MMETSP0707-20130614/21232_1 /TAXON_ID=33640 /ORGANISM="Asterionellopsis glacialis, Strain CCMP134" /LENGTH=397 /DNA_ID=CAMNT_0040359071 /DNA_START=42 /DNA_END=1232 /DNA_ORIENTATION=+
MISISNTGFLMLYTIMLSTRASVPLFTRAFVWTSSAPLKKNVRGVVTTSLSGSAARRAKREMIQDRTFVSDTETSTGDDDDDDTHTKTSPQTGTLDWETFDFSDNPKWDERFKGNKAPTSKSDIDLETMAKQEAKHDARLKKELDEQLHALHSLDPDMVVKAVQALEPFVNEGRKERMDAVLTQRTQNCRFLFENPSNPSNVWACLRTIDSFGIQHVDVVIDSGKYKGKAAISQKRGMRTAMGSAQWLTLRNYLSTDNAVTDLKQKGYRILASDLNPNSKDIRDLDWTSDDRPICIVMGNEGNGITEQMRSMADETFTLPMCGFAESFNLSVATAITLAHLSAASKDGQGPIQSGDLDEHEFNCLRLKGLLNSISQPKVGPAVLLKEGIVLPEAIQW